MRYLDIIFDKKDYKICWSDPASESNPTGKSIQEVFKNERGLTKLLRWASSETSYEYSGFLIDNDDSKEVKVKVQRSKNFFHLIQDSSSGETVFSESFWSVFSQTFPGGVLFISEKEKIVELSHSLLELIKVKNRDGISISKKSLIEQSLPILFGNNSDDPLYIEISRKNKNFSFNDLPSVVEVDYLDNNLRIIQGPVFNKRKYIGSCIYFFDITKELEQQELIKNQELKLFQSSRLAALGEMAGGIAHEINNPLAIISSSTQTLKKAKEKSKLTDDLFKDVIQDIDNTVLRMTKIISGLRVVTRESDGLDLAPVVLREIFTDVLALCCERFKSNDVAFDLDLSLPEFDLVVIGDRVQLSQVFLNLIVNAYDAILKLNEKWVKVCIESSSDSIAIRIIDSGPGIPEEIACKMFDPFFTSKEIGKGTGLGLSISKKIIENNLGTLELEENSKNTCFRVSLKTNN